MNKVSLSIKIVSFLLAIRLICSSLIATGTTEIFQSNVTTNPTLSLTQQAAPQSSLHLWIETLYTLIKKTASLNYQTSKELIFPIPETNQEIVFKWGFGASGDMYTPLPGITTTIQPAQHTYDYVDTTTTFFTGLGKAILENELTKTQKKIALEQWLTEKLTPYMLFSIKFMLLMKEALVQSRENVTGALQYVYPEIFRLLFRLSLTKITDSESTTQTTISAYIPETIAQLVNSFSPEILRFVDDVWGGLQGKTQNLETTHRQTIVCYVFKSEPLARNIFQAFQKAGTDSKQIADALFSFKTQYSGQVMNFKDFRKLHDPNEQPRTTILANNMVGHKELTNSTDISQDEELPTEVKASIATATSTSTIMLTPTSTQEFWLTIIIEEAEMVNTYRKIVMSFVQAFRTYVTLKKEYLTSHQEEARTYNQKTEKRNTENATLQSFLKSSEGKQAFGKLKKSLATIQKTSSEADVAKELLNRQKQLLSEITALEKELSTHQSALDEWKMFKKNTENQDTRTTDSHMDITEKNMQKILARIKQKQKELQELELSIKTDPGYDKALQEETDRKNLARLQALQKEQENNGQEISLELINAIELLKNKLETAQNSPQQTVSFVSRLAKRQQIANLLKAECTLMKQQLDEKRKAIQSIQNPETRIIEELLFNQQALGYEIYIARMLTEATRLLEENQKAELLNNYKKALKKVSFSALTPQDQTTIQTLEAEIGYLFTSSDDENVLDKILGKNDDLREFMADINDNQSSFYQINIQLMQKIATIIKHSSHIQNNLVLYRYLVQKFQTFFPDLLPIFSKALEATGATFAQDTPKNPAVTTAPIFDKGQNNPCLLSQVA